MQKDLLRMALDEMSKDLSESHSSGPKTQKMTDTNEEDLEDSSYTPPKPG